MTSGLERLVIGTVFLSRFLPTLERGRFPIARLAVGSLVQEDLLGLYGTFPQGLEQIDGPVSHGFLRRYCWTIDFTRMTMRFAPPA